MILLIDYLETTILDLRPRQDRDSRPSLVESLRQKQKECNQTI